MAYLDTTAFGNDTALDWLEDIEKNSLSAELRRVFSTYMKFSIDAVRRWSNEEIAEFIDARISTYSTWPLPDHARAAGKDMDQFLRDARANLEDRYYSGRYLLEKYGDIEIVIAAAEIVDCWAQKREADSPDSHVRKRVAKIIKSQARAPTAALKQKAVAALQKARGSKEYEAVLRDLFTGYADGVLANIDRLIKNLSVA